MPATTIPIAPSGVVVVYAKDGQEEAKQLVAKLTADGIEAVSLHDLLQPEVGVPWLVDIENVVERSLKVVVVFTPVLVTSDAMSLLVGMAIRAKKFVPVLTDIAVQLPMGVSMYSPGNVLDPSAPHHYTTLLRGLRGTNTMPRIIIQGSGAAPIGPPPAGIRVRCTACGALLETIDHEPEAVPTVSSDQGISSTPGWNIPCTCRFVVFFPVPGF